jgi:hypothetical protein
MTAATPRSFGLSALVAGIAVFMTDMDLGLLGYILIALAILLLLHTGLSIAVNHSPAHPGETSARSGFRPPAG